MPEKLSKPNRNALRAYLMLRTLYKRGFQQLRIIPGMSPSGMHYRAGITFAKSVARDHGARAIDFELVAHNTSANEAALFELRDAKGAKISTLADFFLMRFPLIAEARYAPDPRYAEWFEAALTFVRSAKYPIAFSDWDEQKIWLPTTETSESGLPMPPPGLNERSGFYE